MVSGLCHDQSHWSFTWEKDHDRENRQENHASQEKTQIVICVYFFYFNKQRLFVFKVD